MSMLFNDVIVAIASPSVPAARGVVRITGQQTNQVLSRLGLTLADRVPNRSDQTLHLSAPLGDVPVTLLHWPSSRSYTGQPSAEIHTYGCVPILAAITDACVGGGARVAKPGEFTMRAFLAGQLDLPQAEAVLGVIDAELPGSLDHALSQLAGNLSRPLASIRSDLLDLLADVEAGLDFVDEDIEFVSDEVLVERLRDLHGQLDSAAQQIQQRGGTSSAVSIVLRGEPNAGKSRLLNRIAGQEAAIVADVSGTTRDVVTVEAMIGDHMVQLVDTAGIESSPGEISRASQDKADTASTHADLRLWCVDASRDDFAEIVSKTHALSAQSQRPSSRDLLVATKADLLNPMSAVPAGWMRCSAVENDGIRELQTTIGNWLDARDAEELGSSIGTAARCQETMQRAREAIVAAIDLTETCAGHEFVSAELRLATQCIGEVTGEIYNEDILDRVFGRFCIGK